MKSKYRNNREDQNPEPERHAVWEKTFNFSPVPYSSNNRSRKKNFCQQIQDVISDSNFIYVDLLLDMRIELYTNLKELHRIHKVPDLDNSLKLICDSLKGAKGLVIDDCQFQHISISTIDTCLSPHFRIEIRSISDEYMMKPVSLFEMPDGLYYPLSITTLDSEGKRETLKHVIFVEEAHHVLHKNKQETKSGESIVEILIREIRELGEGIIMLDQMPCLFSLPGIANSYTTISFNLKTGSDMRAIVDSMGLTLDDQRFLGRLNIGEAIVKLQGRIRNPVMVRIPHFPVKKGQITDEWLKSHHNKSDSGDSEAHLGSQKEKEAIPAPLKTDKEDVGKMASGLSEDEYGFLKDIADHPTSQVVERYEWLNLSIQKGNGIKEKLDFTGSISSI